MKLGRFLQQTRQGGDLSRELSYFGHEILHLLPTNSDLVI